MSMRDFMTRMLNTPRVVAEIAPPIVMETTPRVVVETAPSIVVEDGFDPSPSPEEPFYWDIESRSAAVLGSGKQGMGAFPKVSIRPSKTKFLVPDLIVDRNPIELPYPVKPVSLCVEILSPDDRLSAMFAKCEEYHAWGCPWCWVIDPVRQAAYEYHAGSCLNPVNRAGILRAGEIAISMEELFSALESRIPH